jgi:hypothetical protein
MNQPLSFGLPRKGDFQHHMVCGPFEPRLDDLLDLRGYHGVVPDGFYPWGTMRDAAGNAYSIVRRVPYGLPIAVTEKGDERKAVGRRLMFSTNKGHDAMVLNVDVLRAAGVSDGAVVERVGDAVEMRPAADPRGKNWKLRVTEKSFHWEEQDVCSIDGEIIWPGLQWYLIARDESTFYASLMFHAKGQIMGEPVEGFIFLEQAYMAEGGMLYAHRDTLVAKGVETTWNTFATRYDDGSIEAGHVILGNDRSGFFMVTDGKNVLKRTSNATGEVLRATDGPWHAGIRIDADGEAWEIVTEPRLRLVSTAKMPNPQQEGRMQRVGETRKAVAWCNWGESAPHHGSIGRNRFAI